MCHYCGASLAKSNNCTEQKNEYSAELNCGQSINACNFCGVKNCKDSVYRKNSSSHTMPSNNHTASLRSSESSLSSCSDVSVDANISDRGYLEEGSTQEDASSSLIGHIDGSNLPVKVNGFHQTGNMVKQENGEATTLDSLDPGRNIEVTAAVEIQRGTDNNQERVDSSIDEEIGKSRSKAEEDAEFWLPPEPEDQEDDIVGSVANYEDDDDECGDGVNWAKPSSLSSFGEEGSGSYKFKEAKHKAMNDVRTGKFMTLVSQLLKSVGVDPSGNNDENWVDIVTSLSWEAASFVKPVAQEGKAMDPDGYVKIKCVATGSRTQSHVIKGLVFKKHAAHKHMPTKYNNPRLLLIHGSLDLSSGGLSSIEVMKQDKNSLKSIVEMIDMSHPNVILVEKSVSRDIQESILAKGMTLVFDMKLHRLERVARCIGSPIWSSEVAAGQILRQCDSFHIEKFVEEHAVSTEGGRKQSKTLMFLEGAPTRQGCTILLMGANSDELKRIKCVVRCAVVMAYHFMLETSFLLDQTAMFSTISPGKVVDLAFDNKQATIDSGQKGPDSENNSPLMLQIPISNMESDNQTPSPEGNPSLSFEPYGSATFPGLSLSTSIQKVMDDSFPLFSDSSENMPNPLGLGAEKPDNHAENEIQISCAPEIGDQGEDKPKVSSEEENLLDIEQPYLPDDQINNKNEISSVLDSESILVLMSSRNALRGTICEQRHFSHIKFYRSFDVPLGKFLRENLLNQRLQCKTCGDPPEVHFFYYAHHNKQLTIQVKRLPPARVLPGETEGKLWMWSRCGQCKLQDAISKSTKRVLISSAARGLSFGKFLELSFSNQSSFNCPSSCGHSFQKDFLYFFGLGPMVAMFKYSSVATYSVSLPPQKMDFNSSVREDFLKKDTEKVYLNGVSLFLDIEKSLKILGTRYVGVKLNILGSSKKFSDIEEMLKQEKSQFEVDIQNAVKNGCEDYAVFKLLRLNRVRLELLLESCIWDQRIHALLSSNLTVVDSDLTNLQSQEQNLPEENGTAGEEAIATDIAVEHCDSAPEDISCSETKLDTDDFPVKEIPIDGPVEESVGNSPRATDIVIDGVETLATSGLKENGSTVCEVLVRPASGDRSEGENVGLSMELQTATPISTATDNKVDDPGLNRSLTMLSNFENDKGWIWAPSADIRREYIEDLQRGYLPKFGSFGSYDSESMAHKLITDEGSRLHIPLGINNDYILSDFEEEFSSIIACALTFLKDVPVAATEDLLDKDSGMDANKPNEGSTQSLTRVFSLTSPRWSSFGSSDPDGTHSPPTSSLEDSHSSSFDGLDLLDSLVSYGANHPEVSMGLGKNPGKRKYSVVCLYANQFRQLRDRCCPSEVDYIASLSRCRNWDAKGGKSKSFFAKTLDDRLIIKEIKRTEFDSFMKFAPNYFFYMNECYELGNQTCLAKILGIYQVVIRAGKHGKESKHDLLVMENLSFGRQIVRQYDLKGALHARLSTASNGSGDVLLDQNFVNDMNLAPLYVGRKSKRNLQRAVYNDTNFLNSINVMDYSLLVGVDKQRRELVCGIIDYLRQYTWDKQLENWVKSSLVVPKNQLPTIISPKEYKKRFRKFIDTHFVSVPDHWCSRRSSNPCKLCGPASENGSAHKRGSSNDDSSSSVTSQDEK